MKVIFILLDKIRAQVHRKVRGGGGGGGGGRVYHRIVSYYIDCSNLDSQNCSKILSVKLSLFSFFYKLSDVLFILLLNVKMPTTVGILTFMSSFWHFNIFEQDKFNAQLS